MLSVLASGGGWQSAETEQRSPTSQPGQLPPQSMSLSVPLWMRSSQVAASQMASSPQFRLAQSAASRHALPGPQAGQLSPPQSMSVSVPSRISSLHEAFLQMFSVHSPLTQSEALRQGSPTGHALQSGPPQSVPVSFASGTPLWQWSGPRPPSPGAPAEPPTLAVPPLPVLSELAGRVASDERSNSGDSQPYITAQIATQRLGSQLLDRPPPRYVTVGR